MIRIVFEFENTQALDATLLAALGELPAKQSFQMITSVHAQVREQLAAQAAAAQAPTAEVAPAAAAA